MKTLKKIYKLYLASNQKICTDSRSQSIKNAIFFGIKGDNFDGNKFANKALENGAKLAIIDSGIASDHRMIKVNNSIKTLQDLAKMHRENLSIPIIAITGSNGKTTTKELINHLLSSKFLTCSTSGNFNNHIGVPLTILKINKKHEIAIVEMGANHPGEIRYLTKIAQPTHGMITNIGKAHLEGFKNFKNIIKTKNELYQYLIKKGGLIFLNKNDEILSGLINKYKNVHLYSSSEKRKINHTTINDGDFECNPFINLVYKHQKIQTNIIGAYNANNIIAAIEIANYFKVDNAKINSQLTRFVIKNNRSELVTTKFNQIILDAYNANPTSTKFAIENFLKIDRLKYSSNRTIILGDMMELGDKSLKYHQEMINLLLNKKITNCYLVGPLYKNTKQPDFFTHTISLEDCKKIIKKKHIRKSLILIKGSRKMKLEELVEYL